MRSNLLRALIPFFLFTITASAQSASLPFVSPIFGDHMVIQRGKPNTIWGWATPGQSVQVEIGGHAAKATTGANGRWQVQIDPPPVGGPYTLKITGPQTTVFHEGLVGDVWLCGGQSNMQFSIGQPINGADEIKAADHPHLRLYIVSPH